MRQGGAFVLAVLAPALVAAHLHRGLTWMKTRVDPAQVVPGQ